jgi:hypothetical protein
MKLTPMEIVKASVDDKSVLRRLLELYLYDLFIYLASFAGAGK